MPLYVRAGSLLPLGPIKQYTGERVDQPLAILIYLTDPTVQIYRSGFLKRGSPHCAKGVRSEVTTMGVSVGWLHTSPRSSRFHECVG